MPQILRRDAPGLQKLGLRGLSREVGKKGDRMVTFRASTPAKDRHGTIIKSGGIKTERFEQNPIFLWAHDGYGSMFGGGPQPSSVIGRVVGYNRTDEAFDIDVEFAPETANPQAEQALRLVKAGFLNAVSIGFVPLASHYEKVRGEERETQIFDEVELLEVSLVPIPSNPEAVTLVRAIAGACSVGDGGAPASGGHPVTSEAGRQLIADVQTRVGKVLSTKNEKRVREAAERLNEVLESLPTDEGGVETVTESTPALTPEMVSSAFKRAQERSDIERRLREAFGGYK